MFKDEADARAIIKRYCIDEADTPIKRGDVDLLVSRLRPQFWIELRKKAADSSQFRTHFGGTPEMPDGATWPIRLAAPGLVPEYLKSRSDHEWLTEFASRDVPFEFLAQIDLAEAARHENIAIGLPPAGRLLFFWDDIIGTFGDTGDMCRVIWDDTPANAISPLAIPSAFDELESLWRTAQYKSAKIDVANMLRQLPDTLKLMREAGVDEASIAAATKALRDQAAKPQASDPALKKPFVHPHRAMALTPILHLPHTHTAEAVLDQDLSRFLRNDANEDCYRLLTSTDDGPFRGSSHMDGERRRHRFLGTPAPEQDDPRFQVIDRTHNPEGPWSEEATRNAATRSSEWRMLLQVSVADLAQVEREGTIYFIIRNDDLARRDFTQVRAYYQQT